jgi:hypothetical protein
LVRLSGKCSSIQPTDSPGKSRCARVLDDDKPVALAEQRFDVVADLLCREKTRVSRLPTWRGFANAHLPAVAILPHPGQPQKLL